TFHFDIHEHGLRGQVEIPQVVMYELLVPDELAGTGVEREQRVCKAVVSEPGAAVEVRTRRSRRDVYQAMVLVDRHDAPGVAGACGSGLCGLPVRGGRMLGGVGDR